MVGVDSFSPEQLKLLPLWYVAFLLSVTCHEAGHAWAAWIGGDSTLYGIFGVTSDCVTAKAGPWYIRPRKAGMSER